MYKLLPFLLIGLMVSCQQNDESSANGGGTNKDLENKIAQLELENSMKDSVINESLAFFNEIESNLAAIGIRKDKIRTMSNDPELAPSDKQWILEEIRAINYLREDNARLVQRLNKQLDKNGLKIKELEVMVESLMQDIKWKDEQISLLQDELDRLDSQYSVLFDAYQEQAVVVDRLEDKLNTVYYAYGSNAELEENKIITRRNGFIGIGRRLELRNDFNSGYFTKLNASKTNSIVIRGTGVHLMTDHPSKSYKLDVNGASTKLTIIDASEFWKISKYLVVLIDA